MLVLRNAQLNSVPLVSHSSLKNLQIFSFKLRLFFSARQDLFSMMECDSDTISWNLKSDDDLNNIKLKKVFYIEKCTRIPVCIN